MWCATTRAPSAPPPAPLVGSSLESGAERFDALLRSLDVLSAELRYTEGRAQLSATQRAEIRASSTRLDSILVRLRNDRATLIEETVRLRHVTREP